MILLKPSITDIAAAYQQICEFQQMLAQNWVPGFFRSYDRRQAAYDLAWQRHKERGALMRLLFRMPKPPGRPSPTLRNEISERLWQDWIASLSYNKLFDEKDGNVDKAVSDNLFDGLKKFKGDEFFAIVGLMTRFAKSPLTVVIGPTGAWKVNIRNDDQKQLDIIPISGAESDRSRKFPSSAVGDSAQVTLDEQSSFQLIDDLLTYHQSVHKENLVSALGEAERLMSREKAYMLKLAATL